MTIRVSLACNDHRNGNFDGRFGSAQLADLRGYDATLEGPDIRVSVAGQDRLRIGRRVFEARGRRYGVGNWCWDEWQMSRAEALRLLRYLLERGFQVTDHTLGGPFERTINEHRHDGGRP